MKREKSLGLNELRKQVDLERKTSYSKSLSDWEAWAKKSNELFTCIQILEPHVKEYWHAIYDQANEQATENKTPRLMPPDVRSVYCMLAAFAFENLFKAIIIYRSAKNEPILNCNELPPSFKTHDLNRLAKMAEISTSIKEEYLLRRLSKMSIWKGRYPIPNKDFSLIQVEPFSDGKKRFVADFRINEPELVNEFLSKIKPLLPSIDLKNYRRRSCSTPAQY